MDQEARLAFIQSQCVCAAAELEAMKLENKANKAAGHPPKYSPDDFRNLPSMFFLHHNQVIEYLRG